MASSTQLKEDVPVLLARLSLLKREVRALQDSLENVVVNAPSEDEQAQWQLNLGQFPHSLKHLTEHPLVKKATEVKKLQGVGQLAALLSADIGDAVVNGTKITGPSPSPPQLGAAPTPAPAQVPAPQINFAMTSDMKPLQQSPRPVDPRLASRSTSASPLNRPTDPRKRPLAQEDSTDQRQQPTPKRQSPDHPPPLPQILDEGLKELVFTHRSVANGGFGNDHLSFLGETVLSLCTSLVVTENYPNRDSSVLNSCKSRVMPTTELYQWCLDYGLDKRLVRLDLGNSYFDAMVGVFKAYIGGVFLDDQFQIQRLKSWLEPLLSPLVEKYDESTVVNGEQHTGQQYVPPQPPFVQPPLQQQQQQQQHQFTQPFTQPVPSRVAVPAPFNPQQSQYQPPQQQQQQQQQQQHEQHVPEPNLRGLTSYQRGMMESMLTLPVEATRPMKERVYLQVSISFIPVYETYFISKALNPPCFKVGILVNGDLLGIGEAVTMKEAGSRAAWCALNLNWNKLERYRRIAQDVKRGVIPKPVPITASVLEQIQYGFLEGGTAPNGLGNAGY